MSANPHDLIIAPVLSEKALSGIADSRYVFYVKPGSNRVAVRKAVEQVVGVNVVTVNLLRARGKYTTTGRFTGKTADRLKAVVTLRAGQRSAQLDGLT